jgi:tRNA(fMet)-specific endonuclease VapC
MFLWDTDILTLIHADHPRVTEYRRTIDPREIATSIVTRIEILRGRFDAVLKAAASEQLLRAQQFLWRTEDLLDALRIIPFDEAAAREFDRLRDDKSLRKMGRADLLIASITLAQGATLVTRNIKHFKPIGGLRVVNWAG